MGLSDESDQDVYRKFQTLCADLNMDVVAAKEAWNSYERIGQHFTLEGEPLHWLACALYVSCRRSYVPTVGTAGAVVEGNCVSLTRLLRSSQLSLIQFFNKMRNWSSMSMLSQDFRDKVDRLQRNFAVSTVIFKKFEPMFDEIFQRSTEEVPRTQSRKRSRRRQCTGSELLSFCWTLFVEVKSNFTEISDDLVNSYHLLLSCVDLMFSNAVLANRRDLLKSDFPGLPSNYNSRDYRPPSEPPCLIQLLCQRHDGLAVEAKVIKEHHWKPYIIKLIEQNSLRGDVRTLSGLLDITTFEANIKAINRMYESYVLQVGDFDERIFLDDSAESDIGTPSRSFANAEFSERLLARQNIRQHMEKTKSLGPQTPLTGRKYLTGREAANVSPVSTATQGVSRLQSLVSGHKASPSDTLNEIFGQCCRNPRDDIVNRVKEMGEKFCTCYAQPSKDHNGSQVDFAKKRLQLGESLYYKILESMLAQEKKRLPAQFNLSALLEHDMVHRTLLACCLEIVLFSYNAQRVFPWIIEIFNIEAYDFYKVIEMIIRVEDGLSRDVVKHLNHIEESMLESLVWKSESRLWDMIRESGSGVPTYEEVSLPDNPDQNLSNVVPSHLISSPMQHPNVRRLTCVDKSDTKDPQQSPVTPTLVDRLYSPGATGTIGSAKRRLFSAPTGTPGGVTISQPTMPQSKQTIVGTTTVLSPNKAVIAVPSQNDTTITFIPVESYIISADSTRVTVAPASCSTPGKNQPENVKPKRTGSLGLFFRKVYHLAGVRLQDLCNRLNVTDVELRKKMWTCFEHSIIHNTELMKDRHLDQLMLCAVYVIPKVTQCEVTFLNIMGCYKFQPQATSHVYRNVLVPKSRRNSGSSEGNKNGASESSSPIPMGQDEDKDKEREEKRKQRLAIRSSSTLPTDHSNSQPPTPTQLAGTSNSFEFEDRGDIVAFYNTVYLPQMQKFVVKFSSAGNNTGTLPPLSPLPMSKCNGVSPRRCVSTNHRVYTTPLNSSSLSPFSCKPLVYTMSSSPAKDLRAINNMIRLGDCKIGKRILQDDNEADVPNNKRRILDLARKVRSAVTEQTECEEAATE